MSKTTGYWQFSLGWRGFWHYNIIHRFELDLREVTGINLYLVLWPIEDDHETHLARWHLRPDLRLLFELM